MSNGLCLGQRSLTRSKTAPEDVLSLSYTWSSHKRGRQNTLRVVLSNAPIRENRNPLKYYTLKLIQ